MEIGETDRACSAAASGVLTAATTGAIDEKIVATTGATGATIAGTGAGDPGCCDS